jgi:hypothetical protein
MEHLMVSATVVGAIFAATIGSFCLLKPVSVQHWFQRQHNRSNKFVQNLPFSKLIFKPWYPTYLRFMGVFVWMFAVFFGYVVYLTLATR